MVSFIFSHGYRINVKGSFELNEVLSLSGYIYDLSMRWFYSSHYASGKYSLRITFTANFAFFRETKCTSCLIQAPCFD